MTTIRDAYVIGGNRIPFARSGGAYLKASNQDMLTAALDGLVSRYSLAGERLGEVVAGAAVGAERLCAACSAAEGCPGGVVTALGRCAA